MKTKTKKPAEPVERETNRPFVTYGGLGSDLCGAFPEFTPAEYEVINRLADLDHRELNDMVRAICTFWFCGDDQLGPKATEYVQGFRDAYREHLRTGGSKPLLKERGASNG